MVGAQGCAHQLFSFIISWLVNHFNPAANAHSLVDNSIHGSDHSSQQNHLISGNKQINNKLQTSPSQHVNQNRCQSGWMWFNNKCWVTTQSRRDFTHAIELCRKMHNSTLPTIHSEEENEFLRQNIDLHNSPIWLYARHNHQYNRTRWLDKSEVNYTHWDAGQPSDKSSLVCIKTEESWYMKKAEPVDGQTECVSFWEDAKWGTQVGCLVLLPVVCERKLPPIKRYSPDGSGAQDPNGSNLQSEQQQMSSVSGSSSSSLFSESLFSIYLITAAHLSFYLLTITPTLLNQKSPIRMYLNN